MTGPHEARVGEAHAAMTFDAFVAALVEELDMGAGASPSPDATFLGDLNFDSLRALELVAWIEGRVGEAISGTPQLATVGDAYRLYRSLVAPAPTLPG